VRQLAVELSINLNTVSRAYMELELTGLVETQMGSGTFVSDKKIEQDEVERQRILDELCQQFLSRATSHGLSLDDILENLVRLRSR
jgi:GntR family transcriptional regulator